MQLDDRGRGSTANIIAAIASAIIPGLGQLAQGRLGAAIFFFVIDVVLWLVCLGWIMHIWACIDAAYWEPRPDRGPRRGFESW